MIKDYLKLHIENPLENPLGANQYATWRILCGKATGTSTGSLVAKNKTEFVSQAFLKAGTELNKKGGRAKFVQQMQLVQEKDINQRVVKGICSAFLSISARASTKQLQCAISIIQ